MSEWHCRCLAEQSRELLSSCVRPSGTFPTNVEPHHRLHTLEQDPHGTCLLANAHVLPMCLPRNSTGRARRQNMTRQTNMLCGHLRPEAPPAVTTRHQHHITSEVKGAVEVQCPPIKSWCPPREKATKKNAPGLELSSGITGATNPDALIGGDSGRCSA